MFSFLATRVYNILIPDSFYSKCDVNSIYLHTIGRAQSWRNRDLVILTPGEAVQSYKSVCFINGVNNSLAARKIIFINTGFSGVIDHQGAYQSQSKKREGADSDLEK